MPQIVLEIGRAGPHLFLISTLAGILEALENINKHKVGQTDVLNPCVVNAEDRDVEHPLEHGRQGNQFLQGRGIVHFQGLEAHGFRVDGEEASEECQDPIPKFKRAVD